jgi:hypothetical protein
MAHRAALYSVSVHPLYKPKELRRFGNFDKKGTSLAALLDQYLDPAFGVQDGDRSVEIVSSNLAKDDLELVVKHGQTGVAADIFDSKRKKRLHQNPEDSHEINSGVLFQLPRNATIGWLAVHVNGNRSPKQLVYSELADKFRADYDPLKLLVSPAVSTAALLAAVESGQINTVKLTRLDRPTDIRKRITDQWVRKDQRAHVEVLIRAGTGEHVLNNLILKYLKGQKGVLSQITEFSGAEFDNAKVEVTLDHDKTRTFNIENPEAGHAFTVDLDGLKFQSNGEPTNASLFAELRRATEEMT